MFPNRKEHLKISIYLALGANLPNEYGMAPELVLDRAIRRIAGLSGLKVVVRSRWYSSAPVPAAAQPRFINGILRLEGICDPASLLRTLHDIENEEGRTRPYLNAPRTLDLDIIDIDGCVRAGPDPVLPHPRAHLRAFVLLPLRDVAPEWQHPVFRVGVQTLINRLPPQDIRPAGINRMAGQPPAAATLAHARPTA